MSKHTPGPWHISPNGTYIRKDGIHGWNIASIEEQPPYTEANAALISKAPEMYNLLQKVQEFFNDPEQGGETGWGIESKIKNLLKSIDK